MINEQKISGMVIVSDAVWGCYPFVESIKSFLPVVDELVVIYNAFGRNDGTLEAVEAIGDSKIRIIRTDFSIEKHGWTTYGLARTLGYQACTGDVILMFDCDGVLHESEEGLLKGQLGDFIRDNFATGYWEKHRIYKPETYYSQHKHSGIYSKKLLGDKLDFIRDDGKGAPNFAKLTPQEQASKKFSVTLFGYEHVWDTEEVLKYKVNRYGIMLDSLVNRPVKTPEEYFEAYMVELVAKVNKDGQHMDLSRHPTLMQEKVRNVNETQFGFNFFGFK